MAGFRRPPVGDLRHQVTLQDRSQTAGPGAGIDESLAAVATVPARVEPIFGGRVIDGQQTEAVASHNITVRHFAGYEAVDHITFNGRLFRVRSILNVDERDTWLEFLCEELRR